MDDTGFTYYLCLCLIDFVRLHPDVTVRIHLYMEKVEQVGSRLKLKGVNVFPIKMYGLGIYAFVLKYI